MTPERVSSLSNQAMQEAQEIGPSRAIERAIRQAVNEALEEAKAVVDRKHAEFCKRSYPPPTITVEFSDAIRALKLPEDA